METEPNGINQNAFVTYKKLRYMASAVLILLPLIIPFSAYLIWRHPLQYSLSDYYHVQVNGDLPRSLFVMFLAFIGSVFIAYRGIDRCDNRIHNALGTLAFCVAIFPMRCNTLVHKSCVQGILPVLHLPSAISLYAFAFIAVHYGGGKRLKDVIAEVDKINENNYLSKKMKKTKYFSLALMTLGMIAFLVHKILKNFLPGAPWIWSVEYLGFLGFGAYWWCLTYIIDMANKIGLKREKDDGGIVIGLSETMAKRMVAPLASPIVSDEKRWDFIP